MSCMRYIARATLLASALGVGHGVARAQTPSAESVATRQAPVAPVPPPPLSREFRAAWLSPVTSNEGGDWPSRAGLPADSQKAELVALLDRAKAVGLNAIILHVRMASDAMYPSRLAPWSAFLSGTSGVAPEPAYDPLAFAIAEAHARGLQLHAWFNPFRAMLPNFAGHAAPTHVTRAHKSWIRQYGTQTWIDPGIPAARNAVLASIMEVVDRYDVDGVHIDDYFYPYRESETITRRIGKGRHRHTIRITRDRVFPDNASWKAYGRAKGWSDRDAWRRANVDDFVKRMYEGVKQRKPWVLVGVSPFGIWRSGIPQGVTGLDAYTEIYADSRKWLREGWLDYVVPQLYWPLESVQNRFERLDEWWHTQNPMGRHIWPGLYTEKEDATRNSWDRGSIAAEIAWLRAFDARDGVPTGHVHFRIGAMSTDSAALGSRLRSAAYDEPALVPASPWLVQGTPAAPSVLRDSTGLVAAPGDKTPVLWWLVRRQAADGTWQSQLVRAVPGGHLLLAEELSTAGAVWVSAVGRSGVEGPAAFWAAGS
jgi:uncharacterized lipoprotein YddW (UPF0748 family)